MEAEKPESKRKWLILISVAMGIFLATIDGSIVNIGLNTLVNDLGQPLAVVEWVVLAYMLTISTLMLSIGRLGDMVGKKTLYLVGLIVFTIGSVLCGLSPSVYWLIGFRVLQGIGAAMLMALATAIVTEAFPNQERGKALGILGTMVSIGIIAGPTIGGVILESLSWHWLFFVNLPVGIVGVIMVLRFVPNYKPGLNRSLISSARVPCSSASPRFSWRYPLVKTMVSTIPSSLLCLLHSWSHWLSLSRWN